MIRCCHSLPRTVAFVIVLALASAAPAAAATGLIRAKSGPIAIAANGASVWVVNPDANSVTRIDAATNEKAAEIPVGLSPRNLCVRPDGAEVWVTNFESNSVSVIDAGTNGVVATLPTLIGPYGIAISPNGARAYVVNQISDTLLTFDVSTRAVIDRDPVGHRSRAVAVTSDGSRVMVQQFVVEWRQMITSFFNDAGGSLSAASLSSVDPVPQGDGGLPGDCFAIAVAPGDSTLWIPLIDLNWENGPILFPANGQLTLNSTMQAAIREVRIGKREEIAEHAAGGRRRLNSAGENVQMPADVAFTADGSAAYLPCAFSNDVLKIDTATNPPTTRVEIPVGDYPHGIVLSPTAHRAYVANFLSRDVMVIDTETDVVIDTIAVTEETLPPNVLHGKKLFNTSTGRMSTDARMTCAGCHPDGFMDGFNWDFTQTGAGRRNTRTPRGVAALSAFLSAGNWDEGQDCEWTIQGLLKGAGLADGPDFPSVGPSNAGRSQDLDDLAAYVYSMEIRNESPVRNADGSLSASALAGKAIFESEETGCRYCHPEPIFTDKVRHDVGTYQMEIDPRGCASCHPAADLTGQIPSGALTQSGTILSGYIGFITPTLCSIYDTDPYLHNGKARYLQSVVGGLNAHDAHGRTSHLTTPQKNDLLVYLRSIVQGKEDVTPPRIEFARAIDATEVVVRFLEPVDPATAADIGNYTIDNGVTVISASLDPFSTFMSRDGLTVHLYTTPHALGQSYAVTVRSVKDLSMNGNAIPESGASATYDYQTVATFTFSNVDSLFTSRLGRDATLDSGQPTWNFGRSRELRVGASDATRRAALMFEFYPMLSTLVADSSDIVGAKIRLRLKDQAGPEPVTIRAYRLLKYCVEGSGGDPSGEALVNQSSWNDAREYWLPWSASGASQSTPGVEGDLTADYLGANDRADTPDDSAVVSGVGEFAEWDVTHAVRWTFANPYYWDFGHLLAASSEAPGTEKIFYSLEDSVESNRPQLVVTVRADHATVVTPATAGAAAGYALAPGRPSPTRGPVTFAFSLPREERVTLRVFDAAGRSVRTVVEERFGEGRHEVAWDGRIGGGGEAAPGTYFYRIKAGAFSDVGRIVVAR